MKLFGKGKAAGGKAGGRKDFEKLPAADRAITFYAEDGGSWPHLEPIVTALVERARRVGLLPHVERRRPDPRAPSDPASAPSRSARGWAARSCSRRWRWACSSRPCRSSASRCCPGRATPSELGTQYVYVFHSMASTHMIYEPDGFDHYDTVLHRRSVHGVARSAGARSSPGCRPRSSCPHGYGRLDTIRRQAADARRVRPVDGPPTVLVAPSWGPTCIFETIGVPLVQALLDGGCRVIARPHPDDREAHARRDRGRWSPRSERIPTWSSTGTSPRRSRSRSPT